MADWIVTTEQKGFSARKGRGRPTACDGYEDALKAVRMSFQPSDRVILEDADGYRTVITRQVSRKRWRR